MIRIEITPSGMFSNCLEILTNLNKPPNAKVNYENTHGLIVNAIGHNHNGPIV